MHQGLALGAALQLLCTSAVGAGASTPFTTIEAEAGLLGGSAAVHAFAIGSPVPKEATHELEASGGAFVKLARTGDYVSWLNGVAGANSIVIRNSIPDTADGSGLEATINLYVDGVFRQAIAVSSRQSWVYRGAKPNFNNPAGGGMPYHFYNEDRALLIGPPLRAGARIAFRKDPANGAPYYDIDCIDLEKVAPPLPQPPGSLSIVAYGADPKFLNDSTEAIKSCVAAAQSQGKSVWIPAGKFMVNHLAPGGLNFTGVTVSGAGMWHSMLYRNIPLPAPKTPWRSNIMLGTKSTLRDVSVESNAIYRSIGGESGDDYGLSATGENWLIERVWIQHCDAQWLSGSNGIIRDSRVADSWADGININNGNVPNPGRLGLNLTVQNNFVRGTGDDGIAAFSDAGEDGKNSKMDGSKILNNTSVAAWWANGLRVAGGRNVLVKDNLVMDVAANCGIEISIFGTTSQPLESATVTGNVVLRGGGWNSIRNGVNIAAGKTVPSSIVFSHNLIVDSRRAGVSIGGKFLNLSFLSNIVGNAAGPGIQIAAGVTGAGEFKGNTIRDPRAGQRAFANEAPATFTATMSGNSW